MYVLSKDKVLTILGGLCEGQSIRFLERLTGVNRNTIMSWLVRAGVTCEALSSRYVKNLKPRYIEADELHSFIGRKTTDPTYKFSLTNGYQGEAWVFVALDGESKLVISYLVGQRDTATAYRLLHQVRQRTLGTFQLTTDGHVMYRDAAELAFGSELHYGQLMKVYSGDEIVGSRPVVIAGTPDVAKISTSYVERNNLTIRMSVRRLTRKTSAFSKKAANHVSALHLYFAYYNFCRWHRTLKMTPAMAAGLTDHPWTMEELVQGALKKMGGNMKTQWWGWIGIAIALWSAAQINRDILGTTTPAVSEGQGLAEIGKGIQLLALTLPRLVAGWMIWVWAREKTN